MHQRPCAVVDCENEGLRQVCPFDDRYHHHGRIHYPTDQESRERWKMVLPFRPLSEGWLLMCDKHYGVVRESVNALQIEVDRSREQRLMKP
jgi:uncharacterized protein (DUF1684 family)